MFEAVATQPAGGRDCISEVVERTALCVLLLHPAQVQIYNKIVSQDGCNLLQDQ